MTGKTIRLNRLFDAHPECHVHHCDLEIGYPRKSSWPLIPLEEGPERWFNILYEERNHKGRSMGRHDAIDVTSSELRDPTTPPPIARIEKQRAAATTLQSPGRPRRHYRNRVLRERSYHRRLRA